MDSDTNNDSGEPQTPAKASLPPQPLQFNVQNLRDTRSGILMVKFVDGHAPGWKMSIPEAFKDALDIKYTPRQVTIGKDEKGKTITRTEYLWTQGREFSFKQGDLIWSNDRTTDGTTLGVQVADATPSGFEEMEQVTTVPGSLLVVHRKRGKHGLTEPKDPKELASLTIDRKRWNPGRVRFRVLRDNKYCETYTTTQDEFITFLQTGLVWQLKGGRPVDLFKTPKPKSDGPSEEPLL